MAEPCCDLKLNPDITGIGVRAALYSQILLGWIMSLFWRDTFVGNARTAYMTATALLIASFIQLQTQSQDLSLLDGIVVSLITSMMITFAIASNPPGPKSQNTASAGPTNTPSADEQKSTSRSFMQFCFIIFWAAWSFNLWRDPVHFGLKGDRANCSTNDQVTISVFGRQIQATDPRMRIAALTLVSVGFFIALCSTFLSLEQVMRPILALFEKNKGTTPTARKPMYDDPILQNIHTFLQSMAFATLIYLTVSTEQTIIRNDLNRDTSDWSYGQTIALILLLQQVMDVFSRWIERRENEKDDQTKISNPDVELSNVQGGSQTQATQATPQAPAPSATPSELQAQAQAQASDVANSASPPNTTK